METPEVSLVEYRETRVWMVFDIIEPGGSPLFRGHQAIIVSETLLVVLLGQSFCFLLLFGFVWFVYCALGLVCCLLLGVFVYLRWKLWDSPSPLP